MPLPELILASQCPGASGVPLEVLAESFKMKEGEVKQILEECGESEDCKGPNCLGNGIDELDLVVNEQVHVKGTVQPDSREAQAFELTEAGGYPVIAEFKRSERPGQRLRAAPRLRLRWPTSWPWIARRSPKFR